MNVIELPIHIENTGTLVVMDGGDTPPFPISRVFFVQGDKGVVRGKHAHKLCSQFLVCPLGEIRVICTDGSKEKEFLLNRPNLGLLVPPGTWTEQHYLSENAILMVLCDRDYEAEDYMRNYPEFLKWQELVISEPSEARSKNQ